MAEEENMPRKEISEEVPQSEPAPETEQVPEGEAPEAEGAEGAQTPAEDASSADEEASERSSNRKKVIIGVSVVVALIVIFIIILLLLLGSCTHRHSMEHVEGVAATCETPGVIDHWHCDECDKDYLDEDGKELITDIVIPAYGHVLATIEGEPPTCTEPGLTEGKRCVSCNEIVEEQEVIPALGHAYREGEYEVTQEPTCTEEGVKEYVCMRCGEPQKESIPALDHDPVETVAAVEPTCMEAGYTSEIVCARCGEVLQEQEKIDALGHDPVETKPEVKPTCTEAGYTSEIVCTRCKEVLQEREKIPALDHDPVETKPKVPAACEQTGLTSEIVCARCGEVLQEQEVIPALDHDPVETKPEVKPTCTEAGYTREIVCSRCDKVFQASEVIPALGHAWGSPVVTRNPGCIYAGEKLYTCMRCSETKTESIDALGHDDVPVPDVEPDCETAGVRGRVVCDRCGMVLEEGEIIPPLGHNIKGNECINEGCDATACTDLEFEISLEHDCYILIGLGDCEHTHILVPDQHMEPKYSQYGELPVTKVGNAAFAADGLDGEQNVAQIQSISFPDTITDIGGSAFDGCSNLSSVTFGKGLRRIGLRAFHDCNSLTYVRFLGPTTGWLATTEPGATTGLEIPSEQLSSPVQAAKFFVDTYKNFNWWHEKVTYGFDRF